MKALKILLAATVGILALILVIGGLLPDTEASRARRACDTLDRMAYSSTEKDSARATCAALSKEADRRMGRLPAGAP